EIAGCGDRCAATGTGTGNGGYRRYPAALHRAQDIVHSLFIIQRVVGRPECAELGYVGTGGERPPARARNDEDIGTVVPARRGTDLRQTLIHREGQRVAGFRPVEDDVSDAFSYLEQEVSRRAVALRHRGCHAVTCRKIRPGTSLQPGHTSPAAVPPARCLRTRRSPSRLPRCRPWRWSRWR